MSAPPGASDFRGFAPAGDVLVEAAAASFVLLKNDAGLLPLQPVQKLAVIGPNAHDPAYQGGGSAHVNLRDVPTPLEAIRNAFSAEVTHEPGDAPRLTLPGLHKLVDGLDLEYFLPGELQSTARETRDASGFIWQEDLPGIGAQSRGLVRVSATLTPAESGAYVFSVRGSSDCRLRVGGRDIAAFTPAPDERGDGALFSLVDARGEAALTAGEPVLVEVEMALFPQTLNGLTLGGRAPQPADPIDRAVRAARDADAVVLIVGTSEDVERESDDRKTTALPGEQEELIRRVLEANPATVVVVNAASAVDMAWARDASTVLYAWYPGEAFGPALVDVLTGAREPGGRLPVTIGRRHEDYGAWNTTPVDGRLEYPESVFVGYRHFDARELEPEFCFGHGLGYGEWAYDAVRVDGFSVEVDVRNAGDRPAKEIVQLYIAADDARIPRPPRELRAFAPVTLEPGETTTVAFELDDRAFAYWDSGWRADPGRYRILVGRSSRDIRLSEDVLLEDVGDVLSVRSMTAAETQREET